MQKNTKDTMKAATRGAAGGLIACVVMVVFAFASGDSVATPGADAVKSAQPGAVAGVLLAPSTRLIIDFKRTALA